jgi:hypothetical protein
MASSIVPSRLVTVSLEVNLFPGTGCNMKIESCSRPGRGPPELVDLAHHRIRTSPAKVQLNPCKLSTSIRSSCLLS